jgi:hypothetical protein
MRPQLAQVPGAICETRNSSNSSMNCRLEALDPGNNVRVKWYFLSEMAAQVYPDIVNEPIDGCTNDIYRTNGQNDKNTAPVDQLQANHYIDPNW